MSPLCIPYRHWFSAHGMIVWAATGYTTRTPLLRIDGNLNADCNISDVLRPLVALYFKGLPKAIFQQDNARPYVARRVLIFLHTPGCSISTLVCTVSRSVNPLKTCGLLRD